MLLISLIIISESLLLDYGLLTCLKICNLLKLSKLDVKYQEVDSY